ncbi:MAG TPA: hypothetical protein VKZ58_00200 [Longimicrobiales bacterium]|nr:hypothetical protein [Longimicrobiales bacterium]
MRFSKSALVLGMAMAIALPAGAAGQGGLQIMPKAGVYIPGNDLATIRDGAEEIRAKMEGDFAIGLAIELARAGAPVGLRGNFDYITGTTITEDGVDRSDKSGTTMLALTGDLVLRPIPRLLFLQPYLLGGAGIKRYEFDRESLSGPIRDAFPADRTDFAVHLGAGFEIGFGALAITAEVSDYISRFKAEGENRDNKLQNDVFAMVGVRIGLF